MLDTKPLMMSHTVTHEG